MHALPVKGIQQPRRVLVAPKALPDPQQGPLEIPPPLLAERVDIGAGSDILTPRVTDHRLVLDGQLGKKCATTPIRPRHCQHD